MINNIIGFCKTFCSWNKSNLAGRTKRIIIFAYMLAYLSNNSKCQNIMKPKLEKSDNRLNNDSNKFVNQN